MLLPDANLLLYAYDATSSFHDKARWWWETCLSGSETVILCPVVLAGFVRISTHPRVYENPLPVDVATGHAESWLERPTARYVPLDSRDLLKAFDCLRHLGTAGGLTTDALIAAIALRLGATVHSADTDFLRFPGLKVLNPLQSL
jgi:toxin-antitoxin system PIN domain toxin